MTVIPFPCSRFTKEDVTTIAELCCRLMLLGMAGGWARHTSDSGADILRILNWDDELPKYTFDRDQGGLYRVWSQIGLIAEGRTLGDLFEQWETSNQRSGLPANMNLCRDTQDPGKRAALAGSDLVESPA